MKLQLIQDIKPPLKKAVHVAGGVRKTTVGVELVFHIAGKRYRGTRHNREVIDTFLHTGDYNYLRLLEGGE